MRVRDLREIIDQVRSIFASGGAKTQAAELDKISTALSLHDEKPADEFLDRVGQTGGPDISARAESYVQKLVEADADEEKFQAVVAELKADKKLSKFELQKVATTYTGSTNPRASTPKLIDSISLAFYTKLYERDTRAMARRARPV